MSYLKNPRVMIATGGAAVVVAAAVVLVVLGGSDGEPKGPPPIVRSKLTLERFKLPDTGETELLVTLPEAGLNVLDTTGGKTSVLLRCVDEAGAEIIRRPTEWPLLEEAGYPLPHAHVPAGRRVLKGVRGCTLTGAGIDFEGRVPEGLPQATQ